MSFASASTSASTSASPFAYEAFDMAVPIADRSTTPPLEDLPKHLRYPRHVRILRNQKQAKFHPRPRFNTPLRYRNDPETRPLIDLDHDQPKRPILSPKSPRAKRASKSKSSTKRPRSQPLSTASSSNTQNIVINGKRIRKRPAQDTELDLVAANTGVQDTTAPIVVARQGEDPSINTRQNNVSVPDSPNEYDDFGTNFFCY